MRRKDSRRGSALLICTIVTLVIVSISGAYVTVSQASARQTANAMFGLQALYTAEAGIAAYLRDIREGRTGTTSGQFGNGQFQTVVVLRGKNGVVTADPQEATFIQVETTGTYSGMSRRVQVILSRQMGGPWFFALYAGNSSNDPNYTLTLGGKKTNKSDQADKVWGDVYSGGNLSTSGDAQMLNLKGNGPSDLVMFAGSYNSGSSQGSNPNSDQGTMNNPDLAGMNYEARTKSGDPLFVDVAAQLDQYGKRGKANDVNGKSGDDGGFATQIVDENIESHIFRRNPENRTSLTSGTVKNDYFLEDPTQPIRTDPNINGTDAYKVRISPNGNQRVYFVDGNLWVNHLDVYSLKFKYPERDGIQVTFVVKGNVYLGDNLYYNNINKDSVAFIALKDPAVADSGNVYFGDPIYGTTERFESFLYAENNFYDNNIGTSGSMSTNIYGNMSAGNQILIDRTLSNGQYAKLTVQFDERIRTGEYVPPGLPDTSSTDDGAWTLASWRRLP
jgi:hypothetical protein